MISSRRGHEFRANSFNNASEKITDGVETVADFVAIKENFKKEVFRLSEKLSSGDKVVILWRIMEHSVNDGFEFSNLLGVPREAMIQGFARTKFQNKHPDFYESLNREAKNLEKYVNETELLKPLEKSVGGFGEPSDANLRDTLDFVDSYYVNFISKRRLKPNEQPQKTPEEEAVASALEAIKYARIPHLYPDSVSRILAIHFGLPENTSFFEMAEKKLIHNTEARYLFTQNRIRQDFVFNLFQKYRVDVEKPEIKKIYDGALYKQIDVVYRVKIDHAIKLAKKELLRQLILRGYEAEEIQFDVDEQTGEFSVKFVGEDSKDSGTESAEPILKDYDESRIDIKRYESVDDLTNIEGQLYFAAQENNKRFIVGPDGKKSNGYDHTRDLVNINGQLYFCAQENNQWFIVGPDGKEGKRYNDVGNPTDINGKLYFAVREGDLEFVVGPDGKESKKYKTTGSLTNINGQLYFIANENNQWLIVGPDGKESSKYKTINSLTDINGQLYFCAEENNQWFIVGPEGKDVKRYERISCLTDINGLPYFRAKENNQWFIVGPDGKESKRYEVVSSLTNIGGQLYFEARENNQFFVVGPDGKESSGYDTINSLTDINGQLYFYAKENDQWFIVGPDGKESKRYDNVIHTSYLNNKFYTVEKEGTELIVNVYSVDYPKNKKEIKLTPDEERILKELNLVATNSSSKVEGDIDEVLNYIANTVEKNQTLSEKIQEIMNSRQSTSILNSAISGEPELFTDILAAESVSNPRLLARSTLMRLFPEIRIKIENERRNNKGMFYGALGSLFGYENKSVSEEDTDPSNYLTYSGSSENFGGDPMAEGKEVFTTRELQTEMIATTFAGKRESRTWREAEIAMSPDLDDPIKEHTFEIPNADKVRGSIQLPRLVGARIISDRIKGIDQDGVEYKIDATFDKAGNARVVLPEKNKIKRITYSQVKQEVPVVLPDVGNKEFSKFTDRVSRENPELLERGVNLPMDIRAFIESISNKSLKEKCVLIEDFVRTISYYDFDNGQVAGMKRQAQNLNERLEMMSARMEELKSSKPELSQVGYKKYAGVCADFAELSIAMLREAGVPAGLASGFMPSSTSVKTSEAHAVAFVLYPKNENENGVVTVDGTPGGVTDSEKALLKNIQQLSLSEKEKIAAEKKQELKKDAMDKFEEVRLALENSDMEAIKKLQNGELENLVNKVLKYEVRESHLHAVKSALNASRYAGLRVPEPSDLKGQNDFRSFLENEVRNAQEKNKSGNESAGEKFFETISDFIDAYKRDGNGAGAYGVIERIIDLSGSALTNIEKKCAMVVVMYLKATKMKK